MKIDGYGMEAVKGIQDRLPRSYMYTLIPCQAFARDQPVGRTGTLYNHWWRFFLEDVTKRVRRAPAPIFSFSSGPCNTSPCSPSVTVPRAVVFGPYVVVFLSTIIPVSRAIFPPNVQHIPPCRLTIKFYSYRTPLLASPYTTTAATTPISQLRNGRPLV
jgi:hypothetical protein